MAEENYQARATQKHLRRSPRKVRLVVDSVRGDRVDKALKKLEFTNKGAADEVAKVVKSAAANIRDKFQEARLDNQEIYITEIFVNEGATLKRIQQDINAYLYSPSPRSPARLSTKRRAPRDWARG